MKLNADILMDALKTDWETELYGKPRRRLSLSRPVLYTGKEDVLENDRVYAAEARMLEEAPAYLGSPVLVVTGDTLPPAVSDGSVVVLHVKGADLAAVFNRLQETYDTLEAWDEKLTDIVHGSANLQEMVDISFPVFRNPMKVIDQNFKYLAYSTIIDRDPSMAIYRPDPNGDIGIEPLKASIKTNMNLNVRQPFFTDGGFGRECLCVNLADNGDFLGSLTVTFALTPWQKGDIVLAKHLAQKLEQALLRCDAVSLTPHREAYRYFRTLLDGGVPSEDNQTALLIRMRNSQYICGKGTVSERIHKKVPSIYLCRRLEAAFPGSYAFDYDSAIFILFTNDSCSFDRAIFTHRMDDMLRSMEMKIGLSDAFTDPSQTRIYYRQAAVALELGYSYRPQEPYYRFQKYALMYMLRNCCGEFSPELLFLPGMHKLIEHDGKASVKAGYIHTLRCYLENGMNAMKTAYALRIHRSTLQERLLGIEKLMNLDLGDPEQRLRLLISLKLLEYRETESETFRRKEDPAEEAETEITFLGTDF